MTFADARGRAAAEGLQSASRSKRRAARLLWLDGQSAEAYALSTAALRDLSVGLAELLDLSRVLGVDDAQLLTQTLTDTELLAAPSSDAGFGSAHAKTLEQVWICQAKLDAGIDRALGVRRRPPWRVIGAGVGVAVIALGVLAFALRSKDLKATASARYNDEHAASLAIDGLVATEWLLPDNKDGWLDIRLGEARSISQVTLRNAHNRHYNDRATKKFKIDLYEGERVRASVDGEFAKQDPDPAWRIVAVPPGRTTKLRISVLSHFGMSGGLAEVAIE